MIWGVLATLFVLWVGRNARSAHLGVDLLKFELFRHLRYKNAQEAAKHLTYEDLERRLWMQISAVSAVCVCTFSLALTSLAGSWTFSLMTSTILTILLLIVFVKRSQTYRQITLPLFATLCQMQLSRWNLQARPANWVHVNLKKGRVWIRLPKDWNATKPQLKSIRELVNTRVPGSWHMDVDTERFLLTFRREAVAETVAVSSEAKAVQADEPGDFVVMEKDVEDDPW